MLRTRSYLMQESIRDMKKFSETQPGKIANAQKEIFPAFFKEFKNLIAYFYKLLKERNKQKNEERTNEEETH